MLRRSSLACFHSTVVRSARQPPAYFVDFVAAFKESNTATLKKIDALDAGQQALGNKMDAVITEMRAFQRFEQASYNFFFSAGVIIIILAVSSLRNSPHRGTDLVDC